ncbi:hypothetical protein WJ15_10830 [Burkholderia cepacia]|nr:hypothetical protein WJ15_10830 [Burkholderia cepacia]
MLATIPARWRARIEHLRRRERNAFALERRQHAFSVLPHAGNGALAETLFAHGGRQHGHMQCPLAAQMARIVTAVLLCLVDWSTE